MQPYKQVKENKLEIGRWSKQEHERFMLGIMTYGKDWKKVQQLVGTRTGAQVRSHAQKFFNKILKKQGQKQEQQSQTLLKVPETPQKYQQNQSCEISGSQIQQSKLPEDSTFSMNLVELISLIQKQSSQKKKIATEDLRKQLNQKIRNVQQQKQTQQNKNPIQKKNRLVKAKSYKGMDNILSAYQNIFQNQNGQEGHTVQDQSFFIRLAKKYKKYFEQEGMFGQMIDFGHKKQIQQYEPRQRKQSFTLPQGIDGDEEDLNQRRKKLISQSNISGLTQDQKQSFKIKIVTMKQQAQKQRINQFNKQV